MNDSDTTIHLLPPHVANQIAAGEVVERPASALKELIENSIDAGAGRIQARIEKAGKRRIEVEDDGCGMSAADAQLAVRRHATSKIAGIEDLHRIASHGFRGEALPSIASVSRFRMHTAREGDAEGVELICEGGAEPVVRPAPPRRGTKIEVRDLFLNTPARLRFMRSDRTEEAAIVEAFRALALAHPGIAMRLEIDGRKRFDFPAQEPAARVGDIMGASFLDNAVHQRIEHEGVAVEAWLGLPTFHHRDGSRAHFLLNGRVIRDRQLLAALRAGYRDVMFHDRYPVAVVRIEMDPAEVDVNVHPAKREVRFRKPQRVHAAVVSCVRAGIERMGRRVSSETAVEAIRRMRPDAPAARAIRAGGAGARSTPASRDPALQRLLWRAPAGAAEPAARDYRTEAMPRDAFAAPSAPDLGRPLAQIHRRYILAQTDEGIVLVDQHAAHERITYERLKRELAGGGVSAQPLLVPERWRPGGELAAWLHDHAAGLARFGMMIEPAEDGAFTISGVPAALAGESPVELAEEISRACMLHGVEAEADATGLGRALERWLGNRACKGSIKSGRAMSAEEQEALLREMERTPNIAQCNHGRPTWVRLSLDDLDRLFGRRE